MRDVDGAMKWLKNQSQNPTQSWNNLCQSMSRQSYGMGPYGSSAREAWRNVKATYRVPITKPSDKEWWGSVPRGAILYSDPGYGAGHAWVAAGDGACWSNDYKRSGKIDKCPIELKGWNNIHQATVGYIVGAQYYDRNEHFFEGLREELWDGKVPPIENILAAEADLELKNAAAWRLACRLADLGYGSDTWVPVKYAQGYPTKAVAQANSKHEGMADPSAYGPKLHERLFG